MTYLDYAATSWPKPESVRRAVQHAMQSYGNPGRGGYGLSMQAARGVYAARKAAARLFHCTPEQVVFTGSCTQGLNMAIRTLVAPGDGVVISGFEHNAVTRTLHALGAKITVAGRRLFDGEDVLSNLRAALDARPKAAVFTMAGNVFGNILPAAEICRLCRERGVPIILDAAQAAGTMDIDLEALGADFLASPGHKGLLGPMGTGLLLCSRLPKPLVCGGTGSQSLLSDMPDYLPDRAEAGTLNVPGIAGLGAGIEYVLELGPDALGRREAALAATLADALQRRGYRVFAGPGQGGTLSFVPRDGDCEAFAARLGDLGICLRPGLHCAPLAHESAGTLQTGTLRASFGYASSLRDLRTLLSTLDRAEKQNIFST